MSLAPPPPLLKKQKLQPHQDPEYLDDKDDDPKRTLGLVSAVFLIFNRMIGTGIFATPGTILESAGSVGMSLLLWLIGATIAICGLFVYIEYGTALPKSGGEKNYLEFVYRRPALLVTCIYASNAVFLGWAGSNSIVFGEYVLFAAGIVKPDDWQARGAGLACITFALLVHGTSVKWGVRIQNALGGLKLMILIFVVVSGFAAMGGALQVEKPDNFSNVFEGTTSNGYNYASALFKVIWSFSGYNNANYALSEVKNPVRTIKLAGPLAIGIVSVLYMLANISYFSAVTKEDVRESGVVIAGKFFINVFGDVVGRRVLPLFVALSALGNVMAVIFSQGRINQELGKEGVLPFSRFWASNRPFNSPLAGLALHYLFSIVMMLAPPSGDAYNFIVDVIGYPVAIINLGISIGLLLLHSNYLGYEWNPPFRCPKICIIFFIIANAFLIILPWYPPQNGVGDTSLPYYLYCIVGIAILLAGAVYWFGWIYVWPRLGGFRWTQRKAVLSDGTEIVEFQKEYLERKQ